MSRSGLAWLAVSPFIVIAPGILKGGGFQGEELQTAHCEIGRRGGRLAVSLRAEPNTLNPLIALDAPSREAIGRMNGDLIAINRQTQRTEPGLAKSWALSKDGRTFVLRLRRGIRFSDGEPFDADDVLFTFAVYLDEKIHSPQRDLLMVAGKPVAVRKIDSHTVEFQLAAPYSAAERMFDSVAILPRHLLEAAYRDGTLARAWTLNTPPEKIAGLGPFRLKEYRPGERLTLERNPYYWKVDTAGSRLPYLNELVFLFAGSEDAQVLRFSAGETDIVDRLSAANFAMLSRDAAAKGLRVEDLGPGLEYSFLFFNLRPAAGEKYPEIARKQRWFASAGFRQAVSAAIDRDAIVRLVYQGRAKAIWGNVSPGNKLWYDEKLPRPPMSVERARRLLASAGFSWNAAGDLLGQDGGRVEFSILTSSSNAERTRMAALIQDDLKRIGIRVTIAALEFRTLIGRVMNSYEYESALLALGNGDADPNAEMNVWMSNGPTHLWNPGEERPATGWEAEIDGLMEEQIATLDYQKRKRLYDRVQEIAAAELPLICLAGPDVLVAARRSIGNLRAAVLAPYTLWNADELYLKDAAAGRSK